MTPKQEEPLDTNWLLDAQIKMAIEEAKSSKKPIKKVDKRFSPKKKKRKKK